VETIGNKALEKMKLKFVKNPPVFVSGLVFIAVRLLSLMAFPQANYFPDTSTYYSGRFLNFHLVSFLGQAARGWPVNLVYALAPSSIGIILLQLGFSAFVWTYLINTVNQITFDLKIKYTLIVILTILGTSPEIVQHDLTLLSTSLVDSLLILCIIFTAKILSDQKSNLRNALNLIGISSIIYIQKSTFIILSVCFTIIGLTSLKKLKVHVRTIVILGTIFIFTYGSLVGVNVNNDWKGSYSGQSLLWQLGAQSPTSTDFATFLKERTTSPKCIYIAAPFANLDKEIGKILNDCPEGVNYLRNGIQRDFAKFAISEPKKAFKLISFGFGAAMTSSASNYGSAVTIFPQSTYSAFFGTTNPTLNSGSIQDQVAGTKAIESTGKFWLYTPLMFWVLTAALLIILTKPHSSRSKMYKYILMCSLGEMAFSNLLLPSEWVRQTIGYQLVALVSSLLIIGESIQKVLESK
jgi:hypothetical protein